MDTEEDMLDTARKIPKVELHLHLDGAAKVETIFKYARKRGIPVPGETVEELRDAITVKTPTPNIEQFLKRFLIFMPALAGDLEAVGQLASDWCEECARQNILYSEVRYSPHLLASSLAQPTYSPPGDVTPRQVVEKITRVLEEEGLKYKVKVNSILCCMRSEPAWSSEVLELCREFKDRGVVGMDLAGSENFTEKNPTQEEHIQAFKDAESLGIHRTIHAGENAGAHNVVEALDVMKSERLGHGIKSLDDPEVYREILTRQTHLEVCPYSNILTQCYAGDPCGHPIRKMSEDGVNFSISTDDPLVTAKTLAEEYVLLMQTMGLSWKHIITANINAARCSFMPEHEKGQLLTKLHEAYKRMLPEHYEEAMKDET